MGNSKHGKGPRDIAARLTKESLGGIIQVEIGNMLIRLKNIYLEILKSTTKHTMT